MVACTNDNTNSIKTYYDIEELINRQVDYLNSHAKSIRKISGADTVFINSDSINWESELRIFEELDINKPFLSDVYLIEDNLTATNSNLSVLRYSSKYGDPAVREMELHYFKQISNLKKLSAKAHSSNSLFRSFRDFNLEFEEIDGKPLLKKYSINGNQKMTMRDTLEINISVEILYK